MKKKTIITLVLCVVFSTTVPTGCGLNSSVVRPENSREPATVEDEIAATAIGYLAAEYETYDKTKFEAFKVKPYRKGYLALVRYGGEGYFTELIHVVKDAKRGYVVSRRAELSFPISMGFAVNRIVDSDYTVLSSVLNNTSWIMSADKRFKVDYNKMVVEFTNGEIVEEHVQGEKGYIIILDSKAGVKDVRFYDLKGEVIDTLQRLKEYYSGTTVIDGVEDAAFAKVSQSGDKTAAPVATTTESKPASTVEHVFGDRQYYSSLKELSDNAEVIVIGTVRAQLQTHNLSRDAQDPSKENTEFVILGTDYEVSVDRYLKGAGNRKIIMTQEGGELDGKTQLVDSRTPIHIGTTYAFFLIKVADKYRFGGEPYKFKLSGGKVTVDSSEEIAQAHFGEMTEQEFLDELKAISP
ncbi:MAG: hypothetical protein QME41_07195 [Actinomycetota bacterium]|nr:hypothetical protein [Actinomycetota bacterium]